jgi:hypothetical protein
MIINKLINKPDDWLLAIEKDIKSKYFTNNIQFVLHGKLVSREDLVDWLTNNISEPFEYIKWVEESQKRTIFAAMREKPDPSLNRWIKYFHIKDNLFELKHFSPYPLMKKCEKIVSDFFINFHSSVSGSREKITFTIFGDCTYSEKEMRRELLYLVRTGNCKIEVKDGPLQDGEDIVYKLSAKPDTLENMLQSGYLNLEYSDD